MAVRRQLLLGPGAHLGVGVAVRRSEAGNAVRLELGQQRHADPTEAAGQAFGAGGTVFQLCMILNKAAA